MAQLCFWKGTTSKGRILPVGQNTTAPTVAASEFASCTNSGRSRRFGYPPPIVFSGNGVFSAWCLDDDESIVSVDQYNCEEDRHDCVNGDCVTKTTYNTPGVFETLAACQSGCGQNSNCTGECVSAEELAALQQAANNLRSRLCG
jgi:hypothetical protein